MSNKTIRLKAALHGYGYELTHCSTKMIGGLADNINLIIERLITDEHKYTLLKQLEVDIGFHVSFHLKRFSKRWDLTVNVSPVNEDAMAELNDAEQCGFDNLHRAVEADLWQFRAYYLD